MAKASRRLLVAHRRAAVLDHHGAAVELADVGERLEQGVDVRAYVVLGLAHVVYSALIRTYS